MERCFFLGVWCHKCNMATGCTRKGGSMMFLENINFPRGHFKIDCRNAREYKNDGEIIYHAN